MQCSAEQYTKRSRGQTRMEKKHATGWWGGGWGLAKLLCCDGGAGGTRFSQEAPIGQELSLMRHALSTMCPRC